MATPAPPKNVVATVDANDQITLNWDYDPTWFAFDGDDGSLGGFNDGMWYSSDSIDHFEINITRDEYGWESPSGGPSTVTHDGSISYSETYGPNSDNPYETQVGIDSHFRFEVRSVNAEGTSVWVPCDKVYTDPIPPHNPSVSRPDANTIKVDFSIQSSFNRYTTNLYYRKDTGNGYSSWSFIENSGENNNTITIDTNDSEISEDSRYQFRLRSYSDDQYENDKDGIAKYSNYVYADYGNSGNVYFEDDFESGDSSAWETTYGSINVQSGKNNDESINGADEGTYYADISNDSYLQQTVDLSNSDPNSKVIIRYALSHYSANNTEDFGVQVNDGSGWVKLDSSPWEYNQQGWFEIQTIIPSEYHTSSTQIRFERNGNIGICIDRVVVSDILHEYTQPATPSELTLDNSTEREITASWNRDSTFASRSDVEYKLSENTNWQNVNWTNNTFQTKSGLNDGEKYDFRVRALLSQPRHGFENSRYRSSSLSSTTTTILPSPSNLSITVDSDTSLDVSWSDGANNEDGFHVLHNTDSPQGFESGFGNWYGQFVRTTNKSKSGSYSAYSDTNSKDFLKYDFTIPQGTVVFQDSLYIPAVPNNIYHISAYIGSDWCGPHVSIRNGEVQYYDGNWNSTGYVPPTEKFVDFVTVTDVPNQTFDFYVKSGQTKSKIIDSGAFIPRDSFSSGDERFIRIKGGKEVDIYHDDLWVGLSDSTSLSANTTTDTIDSLSQDTNYEVRIDNYTEHTTSQSSVASAITFLNELRSTTSNSSTIATSTLRVTDVLEAISSHGTPSTSSNLRITDVLGNVTSGSSPIKSESSTLISLGESVTSESKPLDSSAIRIVDLFESVESHSVSGSSDSIRVVDLLEAVNSHSRSMTSTIERSGINFQGRASNPSYTTPSKSNSLRIVDLDESVSSHGDLSESDSIRVIEINESITSSSSPIRAGSIRIVSLLEEVTSASSPMDSSVMCVVDLLENVTSHSSVNGTETYRSQINFEDRDSEPSFSSVKGSENIRVIDLLEDVESYAKQSRSSIDGGRTSLEVIDHQINWNDEDSYWYTNWFKETKITGTEDTLAIRSMVVPDAKQPAAIVQVEYDGKGNGKADAISDPIELGRHEQVEELHGIPIDEDGYYRIRITEYSGYNSLYKLDTAIVH